MLAERGAPRSAARRLHSGEDNKFPRAGFMRKVLCSACAGGRAGERGSARRKPDAPVRGLRTARMLSASAASGVGVYRPRPARAPPAEIARFDRSRRGGG